MFEHPAAHAITPTRPDHSALVVDTNVVLDLWLFQNPASQQAVSQALQPGRRWLACPSMRAELEQVLTYAHLQRRLMQDQRPLQWVMAQFDAAATRVEPQAVLAPRCKDRDDQKFIDLAVQSAAILLSRDLQVLKLAKRLARLGVMAVTPEKYLTLSLPVIGSKP